MRRILTAVLAAALLPCLPGGIRAAPERGAVLDDLTIADHRNLEANLRWILSRERVERAREGRRARPRVAVLADVGAWHLGARSVVEALESAGVACRVLDAALLQADGLDGVEGLVLPGGWAAHQSAGLGESGLRRIRAFVEGGGRCLGICAGAFLLAKTVAWEGRSHPYPLGLFDGTAEGPLPGLAAWPDRAAVRLTPTTAGTRRGLAALGRRAQLYYGGPRLLGGTALDVLASYPDGTAAVVSRRVGQGEVVLIGTHPERPEPGAGGDEAPAPADAAALLLALLGLGAR